MSATITAEEVGAIKDAVKGYKPQRNQDGIAADRLRSLVERIERLNEERTALSSDIKDIYTEAKSAGFDVPALRALIAMRKKDASEVEEQETLLDVYKRAMGM
jgi:uncharacterized protein (UPF0335 family)